MDNNSESKELVLNDAERLLLHQLRILEWQSQQEGSQETEPVEEPSTSVTLASPEKWKLTQGITLHEWQTRCVERWFEAGHQGTIKVVTGAGKTMLALAIAEGLQNTASPDLHLAIIVPTVVLLHQWYDELLQRGNLPEAMIGRLGGGYQDGFDGGRRILICVLVSASKKLPGMVARKNLGNRLLLIVDECHRAGAAEMSKVLETQRSSSLGLSATPERDEDEDSESDNPLYEDSAVGRALGRIIFELTYADALKYGLIPPFTIRHYGLPLTVEEKSSYERLSRAITDVRTELRGAAPPNATSGNAFFRWVRGTALRQAGDIAGLASKLVSDTNRRKELLYRMEGRSNAVVELLKQEFAQNPNARVLLFHESIQEAMRLFVTLKGMGFKAIAEHSQLPDSIRENGLDLFRRGIAQTLVSVKSLIEGFNVPAVDVGIVVASSSSVRQRIQSMGRVMRCHRTQTGEEKTSCIHVLYARDTVDDAIYEKLDWEHATGVDRNLYYFWTPGQGPIEQPGPPRSPLPTEDEIAIDQLKPGDVYPGRYEGRELTCDSARNVREPEGRYALHAAELAQVVINVKGRPGKFRITPKKHLVLIRVNEGEDWVTRFVIQLPKPLDFTREANVSAISTPDPAEWLGSAKPGDLYLLPTSELAREKWRFRQKRGGVISKQIQDGEAFARLADKAEDPEKGADASGLVTAILQLVIAGEKISQLERTESGHILYRKNGVLHFIYAIKKGLEFPEQL